MLHIRGWLGYLLIATLGCIISTELDTYILETILFYVLISLYLGFSFSINNCFNIKEDLIEMKKNNPVAMGEIDRKEGIKFSSSLALTTMFLALLRGLNVFLFYSILVFLSFSYYSPPFRLKSKPFLDLMSHGPFLVPYFYCFHQSSSLKRLVS